MAYRVRAVRDVEEYRAAVGAIGHYFGWTPTVDDVERFSSLLQHERMHAVFDDGRIVAGAGAYGLELTLPGGPARCAGVTVVGVLPSHRRRGLLRRMMEISSPASAGARSRSPPSGRRRRRSTAASATGSPRSA